MLGFIFHTAHPQRPFSSQQQRERTFHNLFLSLTKNHLVLVNRSKSRYDKMPSKSRHLTFLSCNSWVLLARYCHSCDTMNWVWKEPLFLPFRSIHFEYHKYLNTRWLLKQLTLQYFNLLKNLHCLSAARKSPRDKNVRSAPIHSHSVMGFLVFFFLNFCLSYKERRQDLFAQNC